MAPGIAELPNRHYAARTLAGVSTKQQLQTKVTHSMPAAVASTSVFDPWQMSLGLARVVAGKLKGDSLQTVASTLLRGPHELFLRFARSLIITTAGEPGGDRSHSMGLSRDIWGIHHPPSEDSKCPQDTSAVLFVYPSPPKLCILLPHRRNTPFQRVVQQVPK